MATKSLKSMLVELVRKARESDEMDPVKFVDDHLDDAESRHEVPSKEAVKFGPTQASSGEGAVRMINDYSDPAPQQAITQEYIEFNRKLDKRLARVEKASAQMGALLAGFLDAVAKSESDEEDGSEGSEEREIREETEKAVRKAKLALFKAEMDDEEDEEHEEAVISAEKAVARAIKALTKAAEIASERDDDEEMEKCSKAIRNLKKSLAALKKAGDDKGEEKAEKGNQAAEEDPESGNQDSKESMKAMILETLREAGVVKAEPTDTGVQKAVNDLSVQVGTLSDLFNSLLGKSTGNAPVFQKSQAQEMIKSRIDRLSSAIGAEELAVADMPAAERVLATFKAVQDGHKTPEELQDLLHNSPASVVRLVSAA